MNNLYTRYYPSPLGVLEISSDETAICSILFQDAEKLASPGLAESEESNDIIDTCFQQLDEYFAGERRVFDLPLAPKGTEFQQKVWHQLGHIPFGETTSYLQMAKRLGDEKVIRAAASANGKNPISIIIPCHRVIGSDGSLVGYAGDLWRKKWLLEHERKIYGKHLTLF